ncbi:MAG: hypothetical protein ACOYXB_12410 [Bacteroidota bacterium]
MTEKKFAFNSVLLGLVAGLLAPFITLIVVWLLRENVTFGEFLSQMQSIQMLAKLLSLCAIPNLLLFFVFIWLNRLFSSRGVLFATILYGLLIIILKLL